MRVVVIGAGLGGLAAAANLVRRGHDVTGLERELVPGGRAGVFAEPGFHIDTGPTMITMPVLLRATFAAAGADVDRYVKLEPLEPMHRATFAEAGAKPRRKDQLGARRSTTRGRPQAACRSSRVPHRRRVERSFDPLDWEAMGLERGTPWSLSHTVLQSGPFRPRNVDPRVPGPIFVGASTVPGSGVPRVLISGRLAAQRVERYARETSIVRW